MLRQSASAASARVDRRQNRRRGTALARAAAQEKDQLRIARNERAALPVVGEGCDLEERQPQPDLERPQWEDLRPNARRSRHQGPQFAIPYPLGTALKIPAVNEDPGRIPYNCRPIAQTNRLSIHAYGAVIDATKFGDYWLWSKGKDGRIA